MTPERIYNLPMCVYVCVCVCARGPEGGKGAERATYAAIGNSVANFEIV